MAVLVVPPMDEEPWPTLGPEVCDFYEERFVYGPGSLEGEPYVVEPEFRAWIYRAYEVFPQGHQWAGRRRFQRCGLEVRKGLAKTEKEAIIVGAELHPEGPVRCDGFDAYGQPVGRPVKRPYIPMLAVSVDQVEELAYGALKFIIENSPDADLFDITDERIISLDDNGRENGKALPLAHNPGARDGARTTLNAYDEPHRLYLPRQKQSVATMEANLPKRPLEDPWSLFVGTAGQPGQDSVAEDIHTEAEQIHAGRIDSPRLFYFRRWAEKDHDLTTMDGRIAAIEEATGPVGEWGPGQFADIAAQWDRPNVDKAYLERVWLNRWRRSGSQFFDPILVAKLAQTEDGGLYEPIPKGAFIGVGFDGARFRDAAGFVGTDIRTGRQQLLAGWEKPDDWPDDPEARWEIDEREITEAWEDILKNYDVWRLYGDPPHFVETMSNWAGKHPDIVTEWWTNRSKIMAYTLRAYRELMTSHTITFGGTSDQVADLVRHLCNAGAYELQIKDDEGQPLHVLRKQDGRMDLMFDYAMAGSLSAKAYLDAIAENAKPRKRPARAPRRIY